VQDNGLVRSISQDEWENFLAGSPSPVFVEFWAPWCGPCKVMAPLIQSLAEQYGGRARFVRINVDESPELVTKFQVFSVPTFIILIGGEPVKRFVGMATRSYMDDMLKQHMGD
jgi:thioredoxin 1